MSVNEWEELIDKHLRGELTDSEKERLTQLLDSDVEARREFVDQAQWDTRMTEVLRDRAQGIAPVDFHAAWAEPESRTGAIWNTLAGSRIRALISLGIAAALVLALSAVLFNGTRSQTSGRIATLTGSGGPLQWTLNGGRVEYDLQPGTRLTGGTVEGMALDSWAELSFNDGTRVIISGTSLLTFSEYDHKELYLREGNLTADVVPQQSGNPMLLHTRTATLEVLGTQFSIEAERFSTTLNVSEGEVRTRRLSDGSTIDVPAMHRVVAAADREMRLQRVPESVTTWQSNLDVNPRQKHGKWSSADANQPASLSAVPYTPRGGRTIYAVALAVSHGDHAPVYFRQDSRIRFQGRLSAPTEIYFGITVRYPNGELAGRFQTRYPASRLQSGLTFDVEIGVDDLVLDPSLDAKKFAETPVDLIVESLWSHTLYVPAELAVSDAELLETDRSNSL